MSDDAPPPRPDAVAGQGLGRRIARFGDRAASAVLVAAVIVYQHTLGRLLGGRCRFHPSCSSYFRGAVEKHGALRGSLRGIARICRCHPWHPGGHDPP